jgi:hypothetical protein
VNPLIKTLIEIYGRIGIFHITPCDGAIPISEADRLAEKTVEKYTQDVAKEERAKITAWLRSLDQEGGEINRFLPTTLANWLEEGMHEL